MKKFERKTKDERRRVLLSKNNVKTDLSKDNLNTYMSSDAETRTGAGAAVLAKVQNVNRRFIAAVMALIFAISCMVVGINFATKAEENGETPAAQQIPNLRPGENNGGGFVTSKQLSINDKGLYDLTLEAYSTGSSITEQIPTDIVLILDQSGSMRENDMPTSYDSGVTANWTISQSEDEPDPLYIKDGENYYRVYRKRGYMYEYHPAGTLTPGDIIDASNFAWFQSGSATNSASSQWYFKEGDTFHNIKAYVRGEFLNYGCYFSYTNNAGQTVRLVRPEYPVFKNFLNGERIEYDPDTSFWRPDAVINAFYYAVRAMVNLVNSDSNAYTYASAEVLGAKVETGMYIEYPMYKRHVGYNQLCYKDANGVEHKLIDATYCDADGNPLGGAGGTTGDHTTSTDAFWNGKLYSATATTSRLQALNNALDSFVDTVASQTNSDGTKPDHRIAIVGFSSNSVHYKNTELLTGTDLTIRDQAFETASGDGSQYYSLDGRAHNGIWHENISTQDYANALLSVNNPDERGKIDKAVDSVTAYGGTEPYYGFQMAHSILNERDPDSLIYTKRDNTTGRRNQVVIFFTDGQPGNYSYDNQFAYANLTVQSANAIKTDSTLNSPDGTIKTPIYSVGTFGEADANPLLYTKTLNRSDYGYQYTSTSTGDNLFLADRVAAKYDLDYVETLSETGITDHYEGIFIRRITGVDVAYSAQSNLRYRIWQNDPSRFPATATDTISDYMETVSSKYPSATQFVDSTWYTGDESDNSDNNDYATMVGRVRGPAESGQYYYLSTNENALLRAFNAIFDSVSSSVVESYIDQSNSLVKDVLSNNIAKTITTDVKLYKSSGYVGEDGKATGWGTPVEIPLPNSQGISVSWENDKQLNVYGYDFSEEFIAEGHPGNKLIIQITDLNPLETGAYLESNTADIGIFVDNVETPYATFPRPSFSRYSYTLNVGSDNTAATFDYATKLVGSGGNLDDVIVVVPETVTEGGTATTVEHRYPYADFISGNANGDFGNWGNETVFYYENVPTDYTIHTSLKTSDTDYTYFVAYDDDQAGTQPRSMTPNQATTRDDFSFDDHVINITSEANKRTVTIREFTEGEFANKERAFQIGLNITKNDQPWSGTVQATINGTNQTLTFEDGNLDATSAALVALADSQTMTLEVPADAILTLSPEDAQLYTEGVKYQKGQDPEVDPGTSTNINQDGIVFTVTYTREPVTDTGISDSDNSYVALLYVAAGMVTLAGGGSLVYFKKRKTN